MKLPVGSDCVDLVLLLLVTSANLSVFARRLFNPKREVYTWLSLLAN